MTLPITRHRTGYAAPLPAPGPEAPPAPAAPEAAAQPRVVIPADDSDAPDVTTVLTGGTSADEVAAAAGRFRRTADLAGQRAGQDRAEAERIMAEARARVAEIMREADASAQVLSASAGQAARQAEALGERARWLASAAEEAARAQEADAAAGALEAEREQLSAHAADLGARLAALAAERQDLAAQTAAARESGDLGALAALRGRDDAAADVTASLTAQKTAAAARLEEIGDGTETFASHPLLRVLPPLARARQDAASARLACRRACNAVWPDRPEAVADERNARLLGRLDALGEGIAGQGAGQAVPRAQVIVRG